MNFYIWLLKFINKLEKKKINLIKKKMILNKKNNSQWKMIQKMK